MKTQLMSVALISLGMISIAFSQEFAVDKGAILISGTGSLTSEGGDLYEEDNYRYSTFTLASSINYFIARHVFIGGALAFMRTSVGGDRYTSVGVGPAVGYAIGDIRNTSYPFLAAGISYYIENDGGDTINGTDIKLGAGMIMVAREHLGIVLEAGYHVINLNRKDWYEPVSGNIMAVGVGFAGLLF